MSLVTSPRIFLVTGGHGFIGSHVAKSLHKDGQIVRIVDISPHSPIAEDICSETVIGNLCDPQVCRRAIAGVHTVLHFAAVMGGMGAIHAKNNWEIYTQNHNMITNLLSASLEAGVKRFFYASSACVYPRDIQAHGKDIRLKEDDAYTVFPPAPQDLYGLEKLHSENLLLQFTDQLSVHIARFHNVYGPGGAWNNGFEKAPAALIRKAIVNKSLRIDDTPVTIEIWGDGTQRRSFLWIGDCVTAVRKLIASDCMVPVNVGSERSISINDLALLACSSVGLSSDMVELVHDQGKPIGVFSRNSNNDLVRKMLHWDPEVSLEEGVTQTSLWIKSQVSRLTDGKSTDVQGELLEGLRNSQLVDLAANSIRFAILLPVTSRGHVSPNTCIDGLISFAKSLIRTTWRDLHEIGGLSYKLTFYVLIDEDDSFLRGNLDMSRPEYILRQEGFTDVKTIISHLAKGDICGLWRMAARSAWLDNCDYYVLMGDDVLVLDEGWMRDVHREFEDIADSRSCPTGFGCVAFTDISFPGMPTFPVLNRVHLDIFGGEVVPTDFINQDGDPFLYQLYRRWGCSRMIPSRIQNGIGGCHDARYVKRHALNWTFSPLSTATACIGQWITSRDLSITRLLTIDIVVPCYRVLLPNLDAILSLRTSETCDVMFIIIVDNPASPEISNLLSKYAHRPDVRIRINETNLGASLSRNKGALESAAEYIHFLDDDIFPNPDLLLETEKLIRSNPNAVGFVANSTFPRAETVFTTSVHLAGVTYFWNIASKVDRHFPGLANDIPWGVTANLVVRRNVDDRIVFKPDFPKTGGGEDIDYCILKRDAAISRGEKGFMAAPTIQIVHPWWNQGSRSYWRFYMWAKGDGGLITMHRRFTYRSAMPNGAESLLLIALATIFGSAFHPYSILFNLGIGLQAGISVLLANVVHDLYRHLWRDAARTGDINSNVEGVYWVLAVMESSLIRLWSEMGRLVGLIERGEYGSIGKRFDWFLGRVGDGPMKEENKDSVQRAVLAVLVLSVALALN